MTYSNHTRHQSKEIPCSLRSCSTGPLQCVTHKELHADLCKEVTADEFRIIRRGTKEVIPCDELRYSRASVGELIDQAGLYPATALRVDICAQLKRLQLTQRGQARQSK